MFTEKITTLFKQRDKDNSEPQSKTSPQVMAGQEVEFAAQRFLASQEILSKIDSLGEGARKMEISLSKVFDSSTAQLKEMMGEVVQKLDETVLAVKSANSDAASPFNMIAAKTVPLPRERQISSLGTEGASSREASKNFPDLESLDAVSDTRLLVVACALMEIAGKNKKIIDSLRTLGLLSRDQMRVIAKVRELLSKIGTPMRPRELAFVVCHLPKSKELDEETTRILDFLSGVEGGGEICRAVS